MSISGVCCELFDAFKNGKISGFSPVEIISELVIIELNHLYSPFI